MQAAARHAWRRSLLRAALWAAAGAGAGALFDGEVWGVAGGLGAYLALQLRYLAALRAWAEHPKRVELPEPGGVWGEVYEKLLDLQRRNRKRKRRLAALLAQFQASAEALPDGAVVTEEHGEIAWFNTAARALLGLRLPQDLGQRLPNLLRHPAFTSAFERGEFDGELELPSPLNAQVTLALRIIPYGANQRLLLVRDVSELVRLERIRRDFVANASHELRTPLTVLRGYIDMMLSEAQGALSDWRTPLQEMNAQSTRMEALVRDLLKLASLEADVATSRQDLVRMATLTERCLAEARAVSRGRHQFHAHVDTGLLLYGREIEIESVVTNLLVNAVQYTPEGGHVTLTWQGRNGGARLTVSDTGIGVAPEDIPRLTERFYRVDEGRSRASGGTGLGLSIVKHALERHEARLEIESRLGEGSRFSCVFPPHRVTRPAASSGSDPTPTAMS